VVKQVFRSYAGGENCTTLHAVLRSPLGDGKESLVIATPAALTQGEGIQNMWGWPEPYIYTVCDRMFGDLPAKNAVYTPFWPTRKFIGGRVVWP
jgi:hypothetical protein